MSQDQEVVMYPPLGPSLMNKLITSEDLILFSEDFILFSEDNPRLPYWMSTI